MLAAPKKHLVLSLGALALFLAPAAVWAAPNCQFSEQLKALSAAQKNSASGRTEDLLAEVSVRKNILRNTLDCALKDAQKLASTTQGIPDSEKGFSDLKKLYLNKLDEASAYYNYQRGRVNDLGLLGSKEMARSISDWRSGNFTPLADNIGNLALWVKNQNLFPVAENRYAQVEKALKGLALEGSQPTQDLLDDARKSLDSAEDLNAKAKDALLGHETPSATGSLLKKSLDDLARSYKDFFDITEAVKKMVPL